MNAILKLFPTAKVRYRLIVRSEVIFPEGFGQELRKQVNNMFYLKLSRGEKNWFAGRCKYIDPSYFDFLEGYRYNPSEVGIIQDGGKLEILIEGYWYRTVLWEVPLMALISELYFDMTNQKPVNRVEREQNN